MVRRSSWRRPIPDEYSRVLTSAHVSVAAFGGAFLAMVGLKHFFDIEKEVHWIDGDRAAAHAARPHRGGRAGSRDDSSLADRPPAPRARAGRVLGVGHARARHLHRRRRALGVSRRRVGVTGAAVRSGAASFLYLEVLDASFSFDGVIGAFALSNNLFVIAIGLGIGAMFVRSLTIMLVEQGHAHRVPLPRARRLLRDRRARRDHVSQGRHPRSGSGDGPDRRGFIVLSLCDSIRYNRRERGA